MTITNLGRVGNVVRTGGLRVAAALLVGTAISAVGAVPAFAQESTASLRGTITADAGGQPTQVIATDINSGIRRTSDVAPDGSYNFSSLRPGEYQLEIVTPSGNRQTDTITLVIGQNAQLDIDFTPGSVTTDAASGDIIVTGDRLRDLEGGEVGVVITQRLIEQLPQNNRNFLAFADLAPGVQFITGANGQSRLQGGAQNSRTINVFIDGVGQKDYVLRNGITGQDSTQGNPFPQLGVGEYRVISSNYKAEYDQVSSVAITAVTKSGTNRFSGEGFIDFTNQDLRVRTAVERRNNQEKVDTRDLQFGGALGGPIIKDLAHFFFTYEGKRREQPVDIFPGTTQNTANIPAEFQQFFGSTNNSFNEDLYFGKIDLIPSDNDLFEATLKVRIETGEGINSGSNLRSNSIDTNVDEYRGLLRWERTGSNWVNDLKLTYEDVSWAPTPRVFESAFVFQDAVGAQIFRTGGGANFQDQGQTGYGLQDDFTYTGFTNHVIKLGVKAKIVELSTFQQLLFNPEFLFNTQYNPATQTNTAVFNDDVPYQLRFGFDSGLGGSSTVTSDNFQLGLYIQDDWEVTDRLTVNLGIRWDYDRTPSYINFETTPSALAAVSPTNYPNLINADYDINDYISDGSQRSTFTGAFQPRIGFSYELDEDARYIVFGGFGRSYDRNQFDFIRQESSVGAYSTRQFRFLVPGDTRNNCTPSPTCVAFDPIYFTEAGREQLVASVGPLGGSELRFLNNDLEIPYSDQYSLGLRTRFGTVNAEIGYTHVESRDGFVFLLGNRRPNGDFFAPGTTQGSPFGFAPPGRGSIILGDNGLDTNADSVYVKIDKRYTPSSPWSLNFTYTYTQAEENRAFGETFSLDYPSTDGYPTLRSVGVPDHRIVTAGSVDVPFDITLSGRLTLQTPPFLIGSGEFGEPFGNRELRTIRGNNRQPFIIGDLWAVRQVDLAATKYFPLPFLTDNSQLRVRVDVLNVLNEVNRTSYNGNGVDINFGNLNPNNFTTGGFPPRTFKLSAGFSF